MRAYNRVLKLARTLAGIAVGEDIGPAHLAKAIHYRSRGIMSSYGQRVV
jgi:predicted ATPase with chaperone activity